jgi:transcriptional regulator with XRE-family HTH domain
MREKNDRHKFGARLGQLYTRAKLTQDELAHRVGVSSAAIRNWEKGEHGITAEKLQKVIEVLLQAHAFWEGEEDNEARDLWRLAGLKIAFDERWFSALRHKEVPVVEKGSALEGGAREALEGAGGVYQPARAIFFFNAPILPEPAEFYGRWRERFSLEERTYNRASTSIIGPNKIGKTWLMHYLRLTAQQKLGKHFRVAYVDALSPSCMTVEGFTALAARQFGVSLAPEYIEQGLTPLEQVVASLLDGKQVPVLCIDRFETFITRPAFDQHFFGGLRALAQAGLCLVTTSKRRLVDIVTEATQASSLINVFDQITLRPFNEREAMDFVKKKGDQAGFTEQERQCLLRYGVLEEHSWLPLRLQLVGQMLLEDKRAEDYQPEDAYYWQNFTLRFEERYRGVLRKVGQLKRLWH